MAYRVALIGGGTGGHVYPLVAIAKKLKELGQQKGVDVKIALVGSGDFLKNAAKDNGFSFKGVMSGKKRRYSSISNFTDMLKMPFGMFQALWHLLWFMPDVAFAKGGYASVLPGLAAWFYRIPLYIHESDSVPGEANLKLSRFAKKVFTSFESANASFAGKDVELVGNPIRQDIVGGNREEALQYFKLDTLRKTILILGGSQGAQNLNNVIVNSIVQLTKELQVIHQVGQTNFKEISARIAKIVQEGQDSYGKVVQARYKTFPFLSVKELSLAYSVADIVVSRAGAVTLSETAYVGKPTIVVPLKTSAANHQRENAYEFAKYGAVVIEEDNLKTTVLLDQINELLNDTERYAKVSTDIQKIAKPEAATIIAQQLLGK
jgi:UDP-N-acetylglucosamine--N-acetylmuramyl-(pentapeptide) pyrophosphoryl-undecaprenol N-acetylglucosamine transferase